MTNNKGVKVLFCDDLEPVDINSKALSDAAYRLSRPPKPKIKLIDRRREYNESLKDFVYRASSITKRALDFSVTTRSNAIKVHNLTRTLAPNQFLHLLNRINRQPS